MARILKRPMFNRGGSSNQGIMDGLVDRRQYELGAFGEKAKQTSDDVYSFMKDMVPPPQTRLPLGSLGADLMSGKGFRDSAINAYGKFTEQDDKKQNYDRQLRMQAAGIGVKDAMAMRNKKSDVSKVQTLATDLMRNNPDKYPNTTVGKSAAFNEALRITETSPGPAKDTMIASLAKQLTPGDNVLGKPARFMRNNAQTIAEQSVNFRQRHPDKNFQTSITYGALKNGSFTFDNANIPVGTYFFDAATGRTLLRKTKGNGNADFITVDEFSLEELD